MPKHRGHYHGTLSNQIHGAFPTGGMLQEPFPPLESRDKRRTLSASGVDLLISPPHPRALGPSWRQQKAVIRPIVPPPHGTGINLHIPHSPWEESVRKCFFFFPLRRN